LVNCSEAINQATGNLTEAAGLLGIKPPNLHRLINELGLRVEVEQSIHKLKSKAPPKK
jgi:DNA-binding NtrC family response regulator